MICCRSSEYFCFLQSCLIVGRSLAIGRTTEDNKGSVRKPVPYTHLDVYKRQEQAKDIVDLSKLPADASPTLRIVRIGDYGDKQSAKMAFCDTGSYNPNLIIGRHRHRRDVKADPQIVCAI